jgi:hypothetical protein
MLTDGALSFTYDAASRLKTVSSNGVTLVTNFYDAKSRRVKKVTPNATTTFFYDDWNLVEERIAYADNTTSTIRYYWGKDLSGTLQGAGGVGGSRKSDVPNRGSGTLAASALARHCEATRVSLPREERPHGNAQGPVEQCYTGRTGILPVRKGATRCVDEERAGSPFSQDALGWSVD